jgi:hypothetical protein
MDPQRVRELAVLGKVRPHARYHARQHHIRWPQVLRALHHCFRTAPDLRIHEAPAAAFLAWGFYDFGRVLRVDFELFEEERLLVVTAFEVRP